MLIVPVIMAVTFWGVLKPPKIDVSAITPLMTSNESSTATTTDGMVRYPNSREPEIDLSFKEKFVLMKVNLGLERWKDLTRAIHENLSFIN